MAGRFLIRLLKQAMVPLLDASLDPLMISVVVLKVNEKGKGETGAMAQLGTSG